MTKIDFEEDDFDEEEFFNAPPPEGAGDLISSEEIVIEEADESEYEDADEVVDLFDPDTDNELSEELGKNRTQQDIDRVIKIKRPKIRDTIKVKNYFAYQKWYAVASVTDKNGKPFKVDKISMELRRGEGEEPLTKIGKKRWQLKIREERWATGILSAKAVLRSSAKWKGKSFSYETRKIKFKRL